MGKTEWVNARYAKHVHPRRRGDQSANSAQNPTDYQLTVRGMTVDDVYSISRSLKSDVGVSSDVWLTERLVSDEIRN